MRNASGVGLGTGPGDEATSHLSQSRQALYTAVRAVFWQVDGG